MSAKLDRVVEPGLHVVRLERESFTEVFITVAALNGEKPIELFQRLDGYLKKNPDVRILSKDVFGMVNEWGQEPLPQDYCANGVEWPVTWVEEGSCSACPVSGIHVHAIAGAKIKSLTAQGRVVGNYFEDEFARYCLLGDIRPEANDGTRNEQALVTLEMMEKTLAEVSMDFSNVVRTWFYNNKILEWYDGFNKVRNQFFTERGVFDLVVPASTGIGGCNAPGTELVSSLYAVAPKCDDVKIFALPSPLQCAALEYGSSFSRAVEVDMPDHRRITISGTASIAPEGHTVFLDDVVAQVKLTMEVATAILESRKMSWADVNRAIAYFKRAEDAPALTEYCKANGIEPFPVVTMEGDVCRDDLLFEVEADAVVVK